MTDKQASLAQRFADRESCMALAEEALELIRELYPTCRSITGEGTRHTLRRLAKLAPFELHEVATGTALFDWTVPREWNVRQAWLKDEKGRTVADFADHNLHLVGYSVPFRGTVRLEELQGHLHSLPEHPEWIPYRTSYYREDWGFCLRHRDRLALAPGDYEVCVDTTLEPGSLTYSEARVAGTSAREVLIYSHACHPSLANDNLTGIVLAALLARELGRQPQNLSYRVVLGPGTIGSLAWLSANEPELDRLSHGLVVGLLGDPGPLTYKTSRQGTSAIDRAARLILPGVSGNARLMDFEPYGYDERQFCSPGFDLPVGRLTRSVNGGYPEYHTSADNIELIGVPELAESFCAIVQLLAAADANRNMINLAPKGEPRLGRRGLYGAVGGRSPAERERAMLWVLNQSDGSTDLLDIAERASMPFESIVAAAIELENAGLLAPAVRPVGSTGRLP